MLPTWELKFELEPNKWVFVPSKESRERGKKIKAAINKCWAPPANYFHLRNGGHVKALESHILNSEFARFDIQNFFGSINKSRVTRSLKELFSYPEAREVANISTVIHPVDKNLILPFGFVQSPILASLCLASSALGRCIKKLPQKYKGLIISVYVDDIILSCDANVVLQDAIEDLKLSAAKSGFELNRDKEAGPAKNITAFNVELSNGILEIAPERYAKFLSAFKESEIESQREGIFSYIFSVNPEQAERLRQVT